MAEVKTGLVYIAKNTITNKSYIGITISNFKVRKYHHLYNAFNGEDTAFYRSIRKYGEDVFIWNILEDGIKQDELKEKEIYYIEKYDTYKKGYNSTVGGEGSYGYKHRKEALEKMSGKNNPMYGKVGKLNPMYGKIGELAPCYGRTGNKHPMFGTKHSEETREKISKKIKEHNEKFPPKKGEESSSYGRRHSKESKELMRRNRMKSGMDTTKGRIVVNNGHRNRFIFPEEKNEYINNGWEIGKRIWRK